MYTLFYSLENVEFVKVYNRHDILVCNVILDGFRLKHGLTSQLKLQVQRRKAHLKKPGTRVSNINARPK